MKKIYMALGLFGLFVLGLWMHFYRLTPLEPLERTLQVHLEGEVHKPGLYELKEGQRLAELLEKAGGLTDDAQEVNLAKKLVDGEKIVIEKRWVEEELSEEEVQGTDEVKKVPIQGKLHKMKREDWLEISGIGPVTADAILDYLKKNPQAQLEDLVNVKGIGEKKLEQLRSVLGKP